MWMNIPIAILLVSGLRILLNKVDFRWKVKPPGSMTYLSHLEKKQLSLNDSRLSTPPPPAKWRRKIDSPLVEAAVNDFIEKILKDFVIDLWYTDITPDREFPEHIRAIIMDALGEVSGRLREINLVDLLTRYQSFPPSYFVCQKWFQNFLLSLASLFQFGTMINYSLSLNFSYVIGI